MLTETPEVLAQLVLAEWRSARGLQRDCGLHEDLHAIAPHRLDRHRPARRAAHRERECDATTRLDATGVALLEAFVQCGIVRLPHAVSGLDAREVQPPVLEKIAVSLDLINAPALLCICVAAGVEDDAVAGLQRDGGIEFHTLIRVPHPRDRPRKWPALFPRACGHEPLMIHTIHPSREKPARKSHLKLVAVRLVHRVRAMRERGIERAAIHLAHSGDILGRLQPALDFETHHAALQQRRDLIHRREILRREQIFFVTEIAHFAVHDQLVRHAARLRALAAVCAALP